MIRGSPPLAASKYAKYTCKDWRPGMPHLNIYLPEDLARKVRKEAREKKVSLSAFVTGLLREKVGRKGWRRDFFTRVVGGWKGEAPRISRPPAEKREGF